MTSLSSESSFPSLSGYLQQKAGFFGRWKKFWFVLSDGILYKFKTKESVQPMEEFDLCGRRNSYKFSSSFSSSSNSLGEISNNSSSSQNSQSHHPHPQPQQQPARVLHNGKHVCGKDFSIALFQEGNETLILLAEDQILHSQWMTALNLSLPKALRISPSSQRDLNDSLLTNSISNSSLSGMIGGATNIGGNVIGHSNISNSGGSGSGSGVGSGHFGFTDSMEQSIPMKQSRMESMLHVLEAVLDPTVISDEKGVIVGFNKSAEELFGWRRDEILSKNVSILMPSMYARFHDGYLERFKKNNDKRLIGKPRRMLAKHKQGHNFPIELSLGEIPSDEGSNDNLAFVAVFRPSYEESLIKSNASSTSDLSENLSDTSPISLNSESRDEFSVRSRGSNPSISSYSLDQDIEKSIHTNREKLDQRLNGFLKSMKGVIDNEYGVLEKKFVVLQQKVNVLEQENERLFQQTEKQHEHIKLLEEELGVLQKASDKFSLVQLLKNESTFKIFVEYCTRNNTQDLCMFYKEAEDYKNKYSHIEGVVSSMEEEAKNIYEKYLSDNAGKNVNIPYDSKSHVKYHLLTPTSDMFDLALNDTLAQLKELSFEKFCESGSGKATLQQLLF